MTQGSPDRVGFTVHTNPFYQNHSYARFCWNPSKVYSGFIKEHVNILLKDGYKRLLNTGTVTKFDEAEDIHFCKLEDLLIYIPNFQYSTIIRKSGKIRSIYLGETGGAKFFNLYNKTDEIKKSNTKFYYDPTNKLFKKEDVPEYPIMRIETRQNFKNKKINLEEAKELSNHFTKLKIFNHINSKEENLLKTEKDKMIFTLFSTLCNSIGMDQSRLLLTKGWRLRIKPLLEKNKVNWWEPINKKNERKNAINKILFPKAIPDIYLKDFKNQKLVCN